MGFFRLGRGGVQVGLHVVVRVKVNKGFGEGGCVRVICDTKGGVAD